MLASSRHLVSVPLRRTAKAIASSRFNVSISAFSSANGACRSRFVKNFLFCDRYFRFFRRVFEVFDIIGVQPGRG